MSVLEQLARDRALLASRPMCGAHYPWTNLACTLDPDHGEGNHEDAVRLAPETWAWPVY